MDYSCFQCLDIWNTPKWCKEEISSPRSTVLTFNVLFAQPSQAFHRHLPLWIVDHQTPTSMPTKNHHVDSSTIRKKQTHVYSDFDRAPFSRPYRTFDKTKLLLFKKVQRFSDRLDLSNSYEKSDMKVFPRSYPPKFFQFSVKHLSSDVLLWNYDIYRLNMYVLQICVHDIIRQTKCSGHSGRKGFPCQPWTFKIRSADVARVRLFL